MAAVEKKLLESVLDGLDRLFDRQSSVIDLGALLFATAEALRTTPHTDELNKAATELFAIVRSGASAQEKRDLALMATDELRHYLARLLPVE